MNKRQLIKEAFIASALVITLDFLISFFPAKYDLIRPIRQGFADFDIYDLRYSGLGKTDQKKDTDITILQIGNDRQQIAEEINRVSLLHPRVIGLDAIFYAPSEPATDSPLVSAVRQAKNLVVASEFNHADSLPKNNQDSVINSFFFEPHKRPLSGCYNFVEGLESVKRYARTFFSINNTDTPSLTTQMLRVIDPAMYDKLVSRHKKVESINYSGNQGHYNVVTLKQFFSPVQRAALEDFFRNKIIIIGFVEDDGPDVLEDMHFTPMNEKQSGKSFPDCYGSVIHANILEMLLHGDFIHEPPVWMDYLIAFVLLFLINLFYITINMKKSWNVHKILFLFQFILAVVLIYIALLLFEQFNIKIDITPVILGVVLSFEIFWIYEWLALRMNKKFGYETFVRH